MQDSKRAPKGKFSEKEEEILKFWQDNKIFEKSIDKKAPKGDYVFYDGPPFATGLPHYGHIVASVMKDVVPRYWTMKGYRVERKWGWDCHGLPIENIVEKEMGSKRKRDIEEIGIDKFNELCRSKVLSYVEDWKAVINRLGRWADMENSYKTMDIDFMESVWWIFKELWEKKLIYEGHRSMHICPRCETTLSQSEVTEGYKDIKDLSATVKFELQEAPGTYILAWTTTPWTLIGNVALAVGEDMRYVKVKTSSPVVSGKEKSHEDKEKKEEILILAKDRIKEVLGDREYKIVEGFSGKDLVGKEYKPIFDYYYNNEKLENKENGWKIYAANFVTTDDGTGVVHIAPAFGEDDMKLGNKHKLPFVQHVDMSGDFKEEVKDFTGMNVKPKNDHMATDVKIIKFLAHNDYLFSKEKYEHSYSHCWRCDTPLINYATSSWFVDVTKIKDEMLEHAKKINWSPVHIKEGRFGNWLEGARDWSISRQRFWASVIPIWRCHGQKNKKTKKQKNNCDNIVVVGSVKEIEKLSGEKVTDLHKHIVDKIKFKCEKCSGEMKRVPDVLDTWFDSGSMPYSQMHYPFKNKKKFDKNFPAEFIAEGSDQTRAWFYYLHVIGTGIKNSHAYKNVIVNGIVLAEDGKKMSKKLKNYPDPNLVLDKYGADALRYYLLTSPVMLAENLNFSEKGVDEVLKKVLMILGNVLSFYKIYEKQLQTTNHKLPTSNNILDQWILTRLDQLIEEVTKNMDKYNLVKATRPIGDFVTDLSTWYLRRSRNRFKGENEEDKQLSLQTTRYVLLTLAKIIAPSMPFMAEYLYKEVGGEKESVHLEEWPTESKACPERGRGVESRKSKVIEDMDMTRKIIEIALAKRAEAGIKVRQPLAKLEAKNLKSDLKEKFLPLIGDEINVEKVKVAGGRGNLEVVLDVKITDKLKQEGVVREIVRLVNGLRKFSGLTIEDRINVYWKSKSELIEETLKRLGEELLKDTLADEIINKKKDLPDNQQKKVDIEGKILWLGIEKVS